MVRLMGELLPLLRPPAALTDAGLERHRRYLQAIADAVSISMAAPPAALVQCPDASPALRRSNAADDPSALPMPLNQRTAVLLQLAVESMGALSTEQASKVGASCAPVSVQSHLPC